MRQVVPAWLRGYGGVIILLATLCNLAAFMTFYAYGLTLPGMREHLGLSHTQEGVLVSAVSVSIAPSGVAIGVLAARWETRYLVGLGGILGSAAMFALGASPSFWTALASGTVAGFGMQMCLTGSISLVPVWFEPAKRGVATGLASMGGGASFIVLGALVPWLTGRNLDEGWRHSWYSLGVIGLITGLLCMAFLRDPPRSATRSSARPPLWPGEIYRSRVLWLVAFQAFSSAWSLVLYVSYFGEFMDEQGVSLTVTGRLWWVMGLLGIGSAIFWGSLSDRLGRRMALVASTAILTVGILVFWLAPVMAGFVASVVLVGSCLRSNFALCAAAMGDYAPRHLMTAALGMTAVGAGLGLSSGAPLGGAIADATGDLEWAFALAAGGSTVGAVTAILLPRFSTP